MTTRRREGREARTDWRVLLRLKAFTLVEARLHTGRTHQIRVHFSSIGHPVAGDTVYGAPHVPRIGNEASAQAQPYVSCTPRASSLRTRGPPSAWK